MVNRVADFFDSIAESWDKTNVCERTVLEKITDIAGVRENRTVLDAGCGTGVMFPFYTERSAGHITGVDVSGKMLAEARRKYGDNGISYVCCDISDYYPSGQFDCVITHNAFPHFLRQREAVERLKALTLPGGTLTVAHSISRADVLKCHKNVPEISVELPQAHTVAAMFGGDFENFTVISDEKCYIVSAKKKG